jgi:hypothetical protein
MRRGAGVAVVLVCVLVAASVLPRPSEASQSYGSVSWALGIVAPEGAPLQGGGSVHWNEVSNVSAEVVLPNISSPDRPVYAVVSVMTEGGQVLQAAAGAYPNGTGWLAYSLYIQNANEVPIVYQWVLNASVPRMAPGAEISVSIFLTSGHWSVRVVNIDTGSAVERPFPQGISSTLATGDQEVFALESYSTSPSTFRDMGNLTLLSLSLNGDVVTGGLYAYGDWVPDRNPVFAVGSYGASPPTFISVEQGAGPAVVWAYGTSWNGTEVSTPVPALTVGLLAGGALVVLGVVFLATRRPGGPGEQR